MKKSLIILIIIVCSLPSCTNDCDDTSIVIKHFENDFGCANTKHDLNIDLTNDYIIIRSKESYDSQVSGTCHPEINFSLFDLVIGEKSSGNWNDTIKYNLSRTCPENKLILTVDIIQSAATIPDNVVYHAIIPKLGDEETVNVKINLKQLIALELSPDSWYMMDTKGWGLYKQGKYQEANELLEKAWDEKPLYDHELYLHLEAAKKAVAEQKNN